MPEIINNIEDDGSLRSDINQVSEEAVKRVQSQSKQAKKVAQEIKKDKAINNQLANFLSFLMQDITDEELINQLVKTFFTTTNPKNQITYLRKDINSYVIVGFFAPFFKEKAQQANVWKFYENINAEEAKSWISEYVTYLAQLSQSYHDNIPVDQEHLITLITMIIQSHLQEGKKLSAEEIKAKIQKTLM